MRRILLLLLLLLLNLLLLQNLALLHFFHDLLGSADWTDWSKAGSQRVLYLRSLYGLIFRLLGNVFVRLLLGTVHRRSSVWRIALAGPARTENELARGALAEVSCEKYVISGAFQKL